MKQFSLLLAVHKCSYLRVQNYNLKNGKYETDRKITLQCFWDSDGEFEINGQRFFEVVTVDIRVGEPISFSQPKILDHMEASHEILSGLGGARYYPKMVDLDSGEATDGFLAANLLVSSDVFMELMCNRHELKRLHLDVMGEKINLNWDGEPSWEYSSNEENALHILGFSYVSAASRQAEDFEVNRTRGGDDASDG